MKEDIRTRGDVEKLVNEFYEKVKADELIGFIFNDIARVNWEKHLPVMYRFWENVLFYTGGYDGNPIQLHKHLNRICELKSEYFERWNELFTKTVDEMYEGENAILAKQRAMSISVVMQLKIAEAG